MSEATQPSALDNFPTPIPVGVSVEKLGDRTIWILREKTVPIVGVNFPNEEGGSRQALLEVLKPDYVVELRREPQNKYDPNAIGVWFEPEGLTQCGRLGYIPARTAKGLAGPMDNDDWKPYGLVTKVFQDDKELWQARFQVFEYAKE